MGYVEYVGTLVCVIGQQAHIQTEAFERKLWVANKQNAKAKEGK
jgi:hypothetical protein